MKAAYYCSSGVIQTGECIGKQPGPDEVRIDVAYCGICGTDVHIFEGAPIANRVSIPQVIGHEMSGEIVEVGSDVVGWSLGDRVVVRPLDPCGNCFACRAGYPHICYKLNFLGVDTPGAFQRFWTVPAHTLHRLPDHVPFDRAALIEPLAVACHDVRRGEVTAGDEAVVIGGGPIGLLIALVAKEAGASVLISEINPFRLGLAEALGVFAVNPKEVDLAALVFDRSDGVGADVVFEVSGSESGVAAMTQLPRARGRIVIVGIPAEPQKVDLAQVFLRELHIRGARVYEPADFEKAIEIAASEALPLERLISAKWPIGDLQQAFEHVLAGDDLVKVLIDTRQE